MRIKYPEKDGDFMKEKVTNIKYKQMDKDEEIKQVTNEMERYIFGEKGIGLLDAMGMTPGKVQKSLDDQKENEIKDIIEEHKEYIFEESLKRVKRKFLEYATDSEKGNKMVSPEEEHYLLIEALESYKMEVIEELIQQYL